MLTGEEIEEWDPPFTVTEQMLNKAVDDLRGYLNLEHQKIAAAQKRSSALQLQIAQSRRRICTLEKNK
jgi:hypothetical protein